MPLSPHVVAVSAVPLEIIAGKAFGWGWETALSPRGPLESLADYSRAELRARRRNTTVVWSIASGHIEIVNDQILLRLTDEDTATLALGEWSWLLSLGVDDQADTPLVRGTFNVISEP